MVADSSAGRRNRASDLIFQPTIAAFAGREKHVDSIED
jgi:hypothetical protein